MSFDAERLRKVLFTLSPLAFAAAVWLMPRVDPTARVGLAYDRPEAARTAARELASRGVSVDPEEARIRVDVDDALERYLRLSREGAPDGVDEVRRLAPPFQVRVEFSSQDGKTASAVRLSPEGRVLGMRLHNVPSDQGQEAPSSESVALARGFLAERLGPRRARTMEMHDPSPESSPEEGAGPVPAPDGEEDSHQEEPQGWVVDASDPNKGWEKLPSTRVWRIPLEGMEELRLEGSALVLAGEVVAWRFRARVEESFAKNRLRRGEGTVALRVASGFLLFLVSSLLLVWGLWRYWLRLRESEVSHGRTLLLAFTVALLVGGALFFLLESSSVVAELEGEFTSGLLALVIITLTTAASVLPLGLLLGAVWSGCEGDVREIFPDRLLSLDALLAGRWLARAPAGSFLAGAAGAAWVVLAQLVLWIPWLARPDWGPDLAARRLLFVHPFQAGIAVALAVLIPYSALGLMAPLSLLRRWTASRWRTLPVLVLFLWLVCLQLPQVTQRLPSASGLLAAGVWVAAFLVPFFAIDLMAAFWTFLLAHVGFLFLLFLHQPSSSLRQPALWVGLGLTVLLALAALVRRFGREVSEAEVRPGYARNIAERLALSAELGAAQQARARMLPESPPEVPGVRLSACCSSGDAAEGDYYDFFPRADGSLALVAADFGRHGLAAALRVTLAKGFLLSYSDRSMEPGEVSRRLEERLTELVEDPEEIALVYGIFRPEDRSLELVSDQGGVWVLVRRSTGVLEEVLGAEDSGVRDSPSAGGTSGRPPSGSTSMQLFAGDTVAFLVMGHRITPRNRMRMLKALRSRRWKSAENVLAVLRKRGLTAGTVMLLQATEGEV